MNDTFLIWANIVCVIILVGCAIGDRRNKKNTPADDVEEK